MKKIFINLCYGILNFLNTLSNNRLFYSLFDKFERGPSDEEGFDHTPASVEEVDASVDSTVTTVPPL